MSSCWPEQEAVDRWWKRHEYELKDEVSRYRIEREGQMVLAITHITETHLLLRKCEPFLPVSLQDEVRQFLTNEVHNLLRTYVEDTMEDK